MQVPLADFKNSSLTHIVSLGPRCAVAYNLRRFFNFGTAYPFDWWILPERSLLYLLSSFDLDFLYDKKQLELTDNRFSVRHRALRILLHHEFPREWMAEGQPVSEDFLDHVDEARSRTSLLCDRLMKLNQSNNRVLFVREGPIQRDTVRAMERLFQEATWAVSTFSPISDQEFGWKSDQTAWDNQLSSLDVSLMAALHKPFEDRGAQHYDDELQT